MTDYNVGIINSLETHKYIPFLSEKEQDTIIRILTQREWVTSPKTPKRQHITWSSTKNDLSKLN